MTTIHVPRPPKSAMNPNRPVNCLLLTQVEHVHAAEKRLPQRYRTDIYVNAIRTEGEAAQYVSRVTAAIHRAHQDAATLRARPERKAGGRLKRAAESNAQSQPTGKTGATRRKGKPRPSKKP